MRRQTGVLSRQNSPLVGDELLQKIDVFEIQRIDRKVDLGFGPRGADLGDSRSGTAAAAFAFFGACFAWHRVGSYLISRCTVWRRKAGLYFLISSFSVFNFLLRVVVYREGDLPSFRASVHSIVMISRGIDLFFFLRLFLRFLFFFGLRTPNGIHCAQGTQPALAQSPIAFELRLGLNGE